MHVAELFEEGTRVLVVVQHEGVHVEALAGVVVQQLTHG